MVALVVAIPVLLYAGARVVLSSSSGKVVHQNTDPSKPGWQAVVEPTPTRVVASLDERGRLVGVTFLAATGDGSAGVVQIPAATATGASRSQTLVEAYDDSGLDGLRDGLENILEMSVADIELVEPGEWASLVARVGTLSVANPDPVSIVDGSGESQIVFPKGMIELEPSRVWAYLSTLNVDESELNLMMRRDAFWRAWLTAMVSGASGSSAGDQPDSGLVSFIGELSMEQVVYETLPVEASGGAVSGERTSQDHGSNDANFETGSSEVYVPVVAEVRSLMARIVPFATGPEGKRPRVEVFDGTGRLDHGTEVAILLGAAGAQIDRVGNASSFDVATTQFVYFDDARRDDVEKLRDALGFGEIVKSEEAAVTVEVTVILGDDALTSTTGVGGD